MCQEDVLFGCYEQTTVAVVPSWACAARVKQPYGQ
jgi:hypothetical protein